MLWVASSSSNNNKKKPGPLSFGERLLDYIEGGPKLRKWYGAPDQLPRDGLVGNKEDSSQGNTFEAAQNLSRKLSLKSETRF